MAITVGREPDFSQQAVIVTLQLGDGNARYGVEIGGPAVVQLLIPAGQAVPHSSITQSNPLLVQLFHDSVFEDYYQSFKVLITDVEGGQLNPALPNDWTELFFVDSRCKRFTPDALPPPHAADPASRRDADAGDRRVALA